MCPSIHVCICACMHTCLCVGGAIVFQYYVCRCLHTVTPGQYSTNPREETLAETDCGFETCVPEHRTSSDGITQGISGPYTCRRLASLSGNMPSCTKSEIMEITDLVGENSQWGDGVGVLIGWAVEAWKACGSIYISGKHGAPGLCQLACK